MVRAHRAIWMSLLSIVPALAIPSPATADLNTGVSSAYGLFTNLEIVAGPVNVNVGPVASVSGTATPTYSDSDSVASVTANGSLTIAGLGLTEIIGVSTGVLTTNVSSDIDGGAGNRTTDADATVNNINLGVDSVSTLLAVSDFFDLQATEITSSVDVTGQVGSLSASGNTTLAGVAGGGGNQASITVLGVEFLLDTAPAANTMFTIDSSSHALLSGMVGSIDVYLNEQTVSGNGTHFQDIAVNALRLDFNGVGIGLGPVSGLLNGDVIFAQSMAMASTPEPASLSMMGLFAIGAGAHIRRRRQKRSVSSN